MRICRFRFALLAIILSISHTLASPIAHASRYTPPIGRPQRKHVTYHPVNPSTMSDYESGGMTNGAGVGDWVQHGVGGLMHMVNREYGLRESESFYWGPAGNPQANLTAFAGGKAVRVLSMERFQNVLDHAKCTNSSVQFTFVKEVQFDSVEKEWGWINDADDNYLVLVTENKACNIPDGDPTVRQPWHVTNAVFDHKTNAVTLSAEPKTWEDAFPSWHLKVSSKGIVPHGSRSVRRGLEKRLGGSFNRTTSIPLAANISSEALQIFGDPESGPSASIACSPCYTTGTLDFDIDVTYSFPDQITGSVIMTADNVGAMFNAVLDVSEAISSPQEFRYTVFSEPIDGIEIPELLTVGPMFNIDLMAELTSVTAQVSTFSAGVSMAIPSNAIAVLDFSDPSRNTFQNWSPTFTAQPPQTPSAEISLAADASIQWSIEFEIKILTEALSAGLALNAPTLGVSLTGEAAEGGVCGVADADFGIDFGVNLGVELDGFAGFGSASELPNQMALLSTSMDLFTTCLVVASGAPTATSTPSVVVPNNSSVAAAPPGSASPSAAGPGYATSVVAPATSQPWVTPASSQPVPSSSPAPATSAAPPPPVTSIAPPVSYVAVPVSSSSPVGVASSIVVVYVTSVVAAAPECSSSSG